MLIYANSRGKLSVRYTFVLKNVNPRRGFIIGLYYLKQLKLMRGKINPKNGNNNYNDNCYL